jgi:hypothetical protein
MLFDARIFPSNEVPAPRVAELPGLPTDVALIAVEKSNRRGACGSQSVPDLENEDRIRVAFVVESECSHQLCR